MPSRRPRRSDAASPPRAARPRLSHPPADRVRGRRHRINRRCGQCQLFNRQRQSHWRKSSQLASAKLPPPGVKLAAADPVQPANQRGRRPRRYALCQYPQLLFEAPAPPPLRAAENLAADLASPRMSTPEVLLIDQPRIIHCTAAIKQRQLLNQQAQRKTTISRRLRCKRRFGKSSGLRPRPPLNSMRCFRPSWTTPSAASYKTLIVSKSSHVLTKIF